MVDLTKIYPGDAVVFRDDSFRVVAKVEIMQNHVEITPTIGPADIWCHDGSYKHNGADAKDIVRISNGCFFWHRVQWGMAFQEEKTGQIYRYIGKSGGEGTAVFALRTMHDGVAPLAYKQLAALERARQWDIREPKQ